MQRLQASPAHGALCGFPPPVGRKPAPGDLDRMEADKWPLSIERISCCCPGHIGLAIIAVVDAFIGYQFYSTKCEAPGLAQFLVLVAVPGVYLVLMYLTFRGQSRGRQ